MVLETLPHQALLIATFNFSSKIKIKNTIILPENHKIIKENKTISHTFNKYLSNFTKTLKLKKKPLKKKPLRPAIFKETSLNILKPIYEKNPEVFK